MKLHELFEATFDSPVALAQHIADNYNKASGKNWKAEEVQVAHLATDHYSQPKMCFNNAVRYLIHHGSRDSKYVLGYVFIHSVPIEHAWVLIDGKHIDTTLDPVKYNAYVKIVELTWDQAIKYTTKHHTAPTLYDAIRL